MVQMRVEGFKKVAQEEDLLRVIEKDDSNSSVTESDEDKRQPETFCVWLRHLLNTTKFQIAIMALVIIDVLVVIADLVMNLRGFHMDAPEALPQVFFIISVTIVGAFVIELAVKAIVFRRVILCNKGDVFDIIVVCATFALSIAFAPRDGVLSVVGLIIALRLWRVTKILNGIVMSVRRQAERRLAHEVHRRDALEQELIKYREYCACQEREIDYLQGLLRSHAIKYYTLDRPVVGSTISVIAEVNTYHHHDSSSLTIESVKERESSH